MALSTDGLNAAAAGVTDTYSWVSLWDGDPQGGGTEVTGGAPAYARKQGTFTQSGGVASLQSSLTFDIPSGQQITHFGLHDASSGGTLGGSNALSSTENYGAQGTYELTVCTITIT